MAANRCNLNRLALSVIRNCFTEVKYHWESPHQQTLKCEIGSGGEVLGRAVLWWLLAWFFLALVFSKSDSGHAVGDSNLNTSKCSLFLLTFSCNRLTRFVKSRIAIKRSICMKETNSLNMPLLNKLSSPVMLCWDPQMFNQAVFFFFFSLCFTYLLTSVTKSEKLLALEIFLSYDMCIWRKLFQFNLFLLLTNAILAFFCTYWGLLQVCLLYYLSSFF